MTKARELSDLLRGVDVDGDLTVDTDTLHVDSTNNRVGIGTSSGANKLEVSGAIVAQGAATAYTNTGLYLQNKGSSVFDVGAWRSGASVGELSFSTDSGSDAAPVERMRIDSSGKVGIGTSSPSSPLTISSIDENHILLENGSESANIQLRDSGNMEIIYKGSDNKLKFMHDTDERMRLDGSGNLLIGSTTNVGTGDHKVSVDIGTSGRALGLSSTATATKILASFINPNGTVGSIRTSGSGTSYVTSSDYRLKENAVAISDGITRIKQLQPKRFNFIADDSVTVDGFMAHEAQAVVPEAVTGTQDAVDDDGNPDYQGIDQAKIVPLLTAALQEAIAKIETLETKVAALEA